MRGGTRRGNDAKGLEGVPHIGRDGDATKDRAVSWGRRAGMMVHGGGPRGLARLAGKTSTAPRQALNSPSSSLPCGTLAGPRIPPRRYDHPWLPAEVRSGCNLRDEW